MYRTMIFTITLLAFVALSFAGNVYSAVSAFKPKVFRMKTWNPGLNAKSFSSGNTKHFVSTNKFAPSNKSDHNRVFRTTRNMTSNIQLRVMRSSILAEKNRELSISSNSPGLRTGFNKRSFNKAQIKERYMSTQSALESRF